MEGKATHAGCGGNVSSHDFGEQVPTLLCEKCNHTIQFPSLELMPRGGYKPERQPLSAWDGMYQVQP